MKRLLIAAGVAASLMLNGLAPGLAAAQPDAPVSAAHSQQRGPVEVVVWNIRRGLGHVRVAVCTRLTFANPHRECPYHGDAPAQAGTTTVVVPDVPAGTYAVQVFQDERDVNVIRRGPLGVPLEGIGFSNDAAVPLTGPRFKDAAFDHDPASPLTLRLKLRYFPDL